jgi:hypothetical protein
LVDKSRPAPKDAIFAPEDRHRGHGIKRGLTAVEAGILMEQPMDKIMTMILFGTIKKNAAQSARSRVKSQ